MCRFFSFIQNKDGDFAYLGKDERGLRKVKEHPDSHSVIADYFRWNVDEVNKFEVDITTGNVRNDEIRHFGIVKDAHEFAKTLDYRKVHKAIKVKTPWKTASEFKFPYFNGNLTRRDKECMRVLDNGRIGPQLRLPSNGVYNHCPRSMPKFNWGKATGLGDLVLTCSLIYNVVQLPTWAKLVRHLISKGIMFCPYYRGAGHFYGLRRNGGTLDISYR